MFIKDYFVSMCSRKEDVYFSIHIVSTLRNKDRENHKDLCDLFVGIYRGDRGESFKKRI